MAYHDDVLALSPAHYWRMGAASGAETDLGSAADDLAITGATRNVTGPTALGADDDGACTFDGSSNFASATVDWSDTSVITLAMWVHVTAYGSGDGLLCEHTATWNSNNGAISIDPNNSTGGAEASTWSIGIGGPAGKYRVTFPQSGVPSGAWHHLALLLDLATPQVKVYVDGSIIVATLRDGATPTTPFASSTFYVASRAGSTQFFGTGIDELVVAKAALTTGQIATLAAIPPPTPATLYVDADNSGANDAGDRTAAQNSGTPLVTLGRALALATDGDTIEVVKSTSTYAALVAEQAETTAASITVKGHAGGASRPVIASATLGDLDSWALTDLIFSGTPGNSSFIYRTNAMTVTRCDFQQGGGQILNWTGHFQFVDCDIASPWDNAHSTNFMTGVGWRITSQYQTDVAAEDLTFQGCHFHEVGGEDAIQLILGNGSHTGTITVDSCHFENVAAGVGSNAHTDCIQSTGVHNLVVMSSRFETSESFLISSDDFIDSLTVEDCLFVGSAISGFSTQFSGVRDATIRHNTWVDSRFGGLRFYVNNNTVATPTRLIYNNIIDKYEVDDGWSAAADTQFNNIIISGSPTSSDVSGFPEFGTSSDTDWELADLPSPSPGIDAGATVAGSPTTDRLGRPRVGAAPDCGCHENQAASTVAQARAPYLISVSPTVDEAGVARTTTIDAVLFPTPGASLDPATVTVSSFFVADPTGAALPVGSAVTGPDGGGRYTAELTVKWRLLPLVEYTATMTSDVADSQGSHFAGTSWSFRVTGTSPGVDTTAAAVGTITLAAGGEAGATCRRLAEAITQAAMALPDANPTGDAVTVTFAVDDAGTRSVTIAGGSLSVAQVVGF